MKGWAQSTRTQYKTGRKIADGKYIGMHNYEVCLAEPVTNICSGLRIQDIAIGVLEDFGPLDIYMCNRLESINELSEKKIFMLNNTFSTDEISRSKSAVLMDIEEASKGRMIQAYQYGNETWELNPTRAFYDWVYCKILHANPELVNGLLCYNAFTDIEFNPKKSLNCQAYAVALYLSLRSAGVLEDALSCKDCFLHYHPNDVVTVNKKRSKKV